MQIRRRIGGGAFACAIALTAGTLAQAAPANAVAPGTIQADSCSTSAAQLSVISFNDFHGRIATANPDTVAFFGQIESYRAAAGEANSLVVSAGDNIGGSLFASFAQEDNPTIDILNAAELDAAAVGNHEFDRGWPDLRDRVQDRSDFPQLGANVYAAGTTDALLPEYEIFDRAGVQVAVIGAVTADTPSMVSPSGMTGVDIGDPVEAVNRVAAQLTDGDAANGEADVIVAAYHEGGPLSGDSLADNQAASDIFTRIVDETSASVDVILNAHTHQTYAYAAPVPGLEGTTRPVMQSASYASLIGKIDLGLNAEGQVDCYAMSNNPVTMSNADALAYPRAAAVKTLVDQTLAQAQVIGAQVVGNASDPITRGLSGTGDNRAVESTMTNLVAQMFREQLGNNDPEFIGVQNPGGTRADFDAGEITYQEAASILPFANTLMTTQLTGAQVKTMLEQQWQRDAAGNVPSRPFLALGLSENVTYTYDESRPEGDRITSITVNGAPIDPAKLYTIGSGSFLISGGDNFRVIADGVNARDTGRVDLEAWVDWIRAQGTVSPDYARRGVSVSPLPTELVVGTPVTIAVGVPQGATALDTLDIHTGTVKNAQLEAVLIVGGAEIPVGSAAVVDGQVAALEITVPAGTAPGAGTLELRASASGTLITIPVTVTGGTTEPTPTPTPKPDNPNKGPGNNSGHDNPNRGPGNNSGHDNPNRGPGNNNGQGPGNNKGQGNTGKGEVKNAR